MKEIQRLMRQLDALEESRANGYHAHRPMFGPVVRVPALAGEALDAWVWAHHRCTCGQIPCPLMRYTPVPPTPQELAEARARVMAKLVLQERRRQEGLARGMIPAEESGGSYREFEHLGQWRPL
jgi:hypothetical protein